MLSIGVMSSGSGSYYVGLSRGDYYTESLEPKGQWRGTGAETLGLEGTINEEAFHAVFAGFSPETGKGLVQNAGADGHRPGWDLTFSAPKSVSALWAQADPETRKLIENAQDAAVQKALDYLEENQALTRRGKGGEEKEEVHLVAASFEHGASRAQDPQLHTHLLVMNIGVREDGTTGSLISKPFYENKMLLGALYRVELARELEMKLSFFAQREGQAFELEGVPRTLCEEFSKRREQIEFLMEKEMQTSAVAAATAALKTRTAKETVSREDLFPGWKEKGHEFGFSENEVHHLRVFGQNKAPLLSKDRFGEKQIERATEHITRAESHFSEKDLFRQTLIEAQGTGVSSDKARSDVSAYLEHNPEIVRLGSVDGVARYTTREILAIEKGIIERAQSSLPLSHHQVSERSVSEVLSSRSLSSQQEEALKHITLEAGSVRVIQGMAGTGKTTLLAAAREAWEKEGFIVQGAALAGKAARGLEDGAGIKNTTIARTLMELDSGRAEFGRNMVLVVDEAGMVDTRSMARLVAETQNAGTKLVLVGDAKQLQPIEMGGAFAGIASVVGEKKLTDIRRQSDPWARQAVTDMASGRADRALSEYASRGLLTMGNTKEELKQSLIEDWKEEGINAPASNLILTATRHESQEMNRLAQGARKDAGKLSEESVKIGKVEFHEGDRVLFKENKPSLNLLNGEFGIVTFIDAEARAMRVVKDGGERVTVPLDEYKEVSLGYSVTTHKAQGMTVDRAYVLTEDGRTDLHLGYVQLSRAREETRIYVVQKDLPETTVQDLARQMQRDNQKEMALQLDYSNER